MLMTHSQYSADSKKKSQNILFGQNLSNYFEIASLIIFFGNFAAAIIILPNTTIIARWKIQKFIWWTERRSKISRPALNDNILHGKITDRNLKTLLMGVVRCCNAISSIENDIVSRV